MVNAVALGAEVNGIFGAVATGLATPDATRDWGTLARKTTEPGGAGQLPAPLGEHVGNGVSDVAQDVGRKLLALGRYVACPTRDCDSVSPLHDGDRHVAFQRLTTRSDTGNLAKFANQISPPIQPGESGVVRYVCEGGLFVEDHYWRQAVQRHTRHLTIKLRHRRAGQLVACTAIEEHPDGSENSAAEELVWDYDGDDVVVTLTRDYLRPGQAVTLRWEVTHALAR